MVVGPHNSVNVPKFTSGACSVSSDESRNVLTSLGPAPGSVTLFENGSLPVPWN